MDIKWIKLSTDIFNHRKIRMLEQMPDGDTVILIWLKLLVLAGEINDGGMVYLTKTVPFTTKVLSNVIGRPEEIVVRSLAYFKDFGMISVDKKGIIIISNWEKYQSADRMAEIREYNRLAKQRERERKKDVNDKSMTVNPTSHGNVNTDKNREEKIREEKRDIKKRVEGFSTFGDILQYLPIPGEGDTK